MRGCIDDEEIIHFFSLFVVQVYQSGGGNGEFTG